MYEYLKPVIEKRLLIKKQLMLNEIPFIGSNCAMAVLSDGESKYVLLCCILFFVNLEQLDTETFKNCCVFLSIYGQPIIL